jgi:segregation and condensation protein B
MMTDSPEFANDSEPTSEPEVGGEGWSGSDIEQAYLKALQAMEDIPWVERTPGHDAGSTDSLPSTPAESVTEAPAAAEDVRPETAVAPPDEPSPEVTSSVPQTPNDSAESQLSAPATPVGPRLAKGTGRPEPDSPSENPNVSPALVIEAALFVGGAPLTARKISGFLRGSSDTGAVEQIIDKLNDDYVAQARPYEIRLGEGGYRLELRPEYDRLRYRVYGSGPREVRLSQDVLEVLALVAYLQPISENDIEGHGKQNAGNLLRQLLRRDLIAFERGPGGRKDVQYHTTARFLSVFGMGSLDELPQAEDLAKK